MVRGSPPNIHCQSEYSGLSAQKPQSDEVPSLLHLDVTRCAHSEDTTLSELKSLRDKSAGASLKRPVPPFSTAYLVPFLMAGHALHLAPQVHATYDDTSELLHVVHLFFIYAISYLVIRGAVHHLHTSLSAFLLASCCPPGNASEINRSLYRRCHITCPRQR